MSTLQDERTAGDRPRLRLDDNPPNEQFISDNESSKMKVYNPADMNAAFADALNSGDIDNLMALYEPTAVLVPKPGEIVEGTAAIRRALEGLLALKGKMSSENQYALVHGEIALLRAKVHLVGIAPDGSRVEIHNHTSEVVRRQSDGSWLYILDHPYGADPIV